jgi:hypothetical protein
MTHSEAYATRSPAGLPPVVCAGELVAVESHLDAVLEDGRSVQRTVDVLVCGECHRVVSISGAMVLNDYLPRARGLVAALAGQLGNGGGK